MPCYSNEAHLRAFVTDGTHNLTGLPVSWTLVLVRWQEPDSDSCEALSTQLMGLIRSAEDRTGQLLHDGRSLQTVLLKTDTTGALSFLSRLQCKAAETLVDLGPLEFAMENVSHVATGGPVPELGDILFTCLDQNPVPYLIPHLIPQSFSVPVSVQDQNQKGILHV